MPQRFAYVGMQFEDEVPAWLLVRRPLKVFAVAMADQTIRMIYALVTKSKVHRRFRWTLLIRRVNRVAKRVAATLTGGRGATKHNEPTQ